MKIDVDVHVHHYLHLPAAPGPDQLAIVLAKLEALEGKLTNNFSNIEASLAALDTSLDEIAGDLNGQAETIEGLLDQIANGLTPEQGAEVASKLSAVAAKARAAADIVDPAVEPGASSGGATEQPVTG